MPVLMLKNYFIAFKKPIASYPLPKRFTYPFYYEPHPLCLLAVDELQYHLSTQKNWQHNFGFLSEDTGIGKMFGILLVQNKANEIGYLAAFSGKLADKNTLPYFVPPVFDMLEAGSFFIVGQREINDLTKQINILEDNPSINKLIASLQNENAKARLDIQRHRNHIIEGRKRRKAQRKVAEETLSHEQFLSIKTVLSQQSIAEKRQLRDLNQYWVDKIFQLENELNGFTSEINDLKEQRKQQSSILQARLFNHYQFLNEKGDLKSLEHIFKETTQITPPAGAGECAVPKLLHYAFKHQLKPLAMAEFWWGASPKSEIRKHGNFYPACQGKCKPILGYMLAGMDIDTNPLLINSGRDKNITIVYEDENIVVINKPIELLSVPGKTIEDSVYLRMKKLYPDATGPLIVHRLDMSTSGLMLIALSKIAHQKLQKQFIQRTVKKRYVALLNGLIEQDVGEIELPLRLDLDDRPRQLVCYQHGKAAKTRWEVIECKNNYTKVYFYPVTGRTHQLRVHAAHVNGLNCSIVGDDLYGNKAYRLHLHADYLAFNHPVTGKLVEFKVDSEF